MPIHIRQRIDAGEIFDAAFVVPTLLDQLEKEGKIIPDTRSNFVRVPIGVAVRAGATKPNISSVDAFRRMLLDANSIAYLKRGTSGPYLEGLFERFGIASELQAKAKRPETDIVGVQLSDQKEWSLGDRCPLSLSLSRRSIRVSLIWCALAN